jgi:hypothetical protein
MKIEINDKTVKEIMTFTHTLAQHILSFTETFINDANKAEVVTGEEVTTQIEPKAEVIPEVKTYTLEEVRKVLTGLSRDGYTEQVKALIEKYGKGKLSQVEAQNYPDLLFEAQFSCREPFTKDEVNSRIAELKDAGFSDDIANLLEHHFATSLEDLKSDYYASFMRDAWRLDHARI